MNVLVIDKLISNTNDHFSKINKTEKIWEGKTMPGQNN